MIVCLSLSPCLDKTVACAGFDPAATNRVRPVRLDLGGKAVNVATALHQLGAQALLVGVDFADSPQSALLTERDVPHQLIQEAGALRTNLKIFDEKNRRVIEVNEASPALSSKTLTALRAAALQAVVQEDLLVLSGSLPAGVSPTFYRDLCRDARRRGAQVFVDCDGAPLLEALSAAPTLIKPNVQEFCAAFRCTVTDPKSAAEACREVLSRFPVQAICLSMGERGALLVSREAAYACAAPAVPVRGLQGAGDSMLAGLCLAASMGLPFAEMLMYGTAAAGASVLRDGTQLCTLPDFDRLLAQTVCYQIN